MSEKGLDLRNNKGGNGGGGSAAGGSIKILFIGNSNMLDSIAYMPAIMKSINPNVKTTIGAAYIGGSCIAQHFAYFVGADASHKVTITIPSTDFSGDYAAGTFDFWTVAADNKPYKAQLQGNSTVRELSGYAYYKAVNGGAWSNQGPTLAQAVLGDEKWDMVVFQDAPNIVVWSNVAPALFSLQKVIGGAVNHAVKFGWMMTHAAANTSALMTEQWTGLAKVAISVMQQTGTSILFAPGSALQSMRTVSGLAALGDGDHKMMCADDIHLQEGIGCYGAACSIACGILNAMGLEYESVIGEQTRPDAAWVQAMHVPSQQQGTSGVIGISDQNCLLAQVAAVNAVKYPYKVISPSLSANSNERVVAQVDEFIPAPATPGTENQMLALDANGKPVWVNPAAGSTVDTEMSDSSTNPVQNKVIKEYVDDADGLINAVIEGVLYAFENGLPRLKVQELTIARKLDAYITEGNAISNEGAGAPTILPQFNGQEYFDTTNKVWYKASFTGVDPTAAAWKPITNPTA